MQKLAGQVRTGGESIKERERIFIPAINDGVSCEEIKKTLKNDEIKQTVKENCPIDCQIGDWGEMSGLGGGEKNMAISMTIRR